MRCNDVGVRGLVPPAHAMVHHKVDDVQHGQINPIEIDVSLFRSRPRLLQAVCLRRWLRAYLGGSWDFSSKAASTLKLDSYL